MGSEMCIRDSLYSEYDEDKDKEVYEVETGESNYYVTVEIKYLL